MALHQPLTMLEESNVKAINEGIINDPLYKSPMWVIFTINVSVGLNISFSLIKEDST